MGSTLDALSGGLYIGGRQGSYTDSIRIVRREVKDVVIYPEVAFAPDHIHSPERGRLRTGCVRQHFFLEVSYSVEQGTSGVSHSSDDVQWNSYPMVCQKGLTFLYTVTGMEVSTNKPGKEN